LNYNVYKKMIKSKQIFFISLFLIIFCFLFSNFAHAEANWQIPDLQIKITGLEDFSTPKACTDDSSKTCIPWIGQYIAGVYRYAIGIVGILAAVILMIGGVIWITAGGNQTRVGEAKTWIGASLTGLLLALCSYLILYQVNPKLTQETPIKVSIPGKITNAKDTGCEWTKLVTNQYCKDVKDGWINSDSDQCSGKKANESDVCCCPPCPEECKKVGCAYCKECENCFSMDYDGLISCKNGCQATQALAVKIRDAAKDTSSDIKWRVTEAWPPSQAHASICHQNGSCVDINFINQTTEPAKVKELYDILVATGLSATYEAGDCTQYPGVNCNSGSEYTTGAHFHVR